MFTCSFFTCATDSTNDLGLANNEIAYSLANGASRTYTCSSTLTTEGENFKLSIKGAVGADGIIMTVKNVKPFLATKYAFYKDVSIVLNEKLEGELNIYVSTGCKENKGILEIVEWDKQAKTITGKFSGPVCTRGIFAHLPGTHIDEGAFYKLKYNEK